MTTPSPGTDTSYSATSISLPRLLLHLEGLAVFLAAIALYVIHIQGTWWLFLLLLFVPDISMIGYLLNPKIGAITYNLIHTCTLPIVLGALAVVMGWQTGELIAVMLLAHIGLDRTIGYGLKYADGFKVTHFSRV